MKTLYLMRHGETFFNLRRKIQGWCDSPLTENGIQQAKEAGESLKGIPFDHYYSSTAERSCDTLELVAGDVEYKRMKGLKERNFGKFEGESEDLHPIIDGEVMFDDVYPVYYNGETSAELTKRVSETLTSIMEQDDNETVLAVSHGGAVYSFLTTLELPKSMYPLIINNCNVFKIGYENGKFVFLEKVHGE